MQRLWRVMTAALIVTSAWAIFHANVARANDAPAPPKLRLPADVVVPLRYRVELTAIPDQDTFTGVIDIDLQFIKPTSVVWLNAEKLVVRSASLAVGSRKFAAKVITEPKDYVGFAFGHPSRPGPAPPR